MAEGEREMTDDPNEAYEVVPIEPGRDGNGTVARASATRRETVDDLGLKVKK